MLHWLLASGANDAAIVAFRVIGPYEALSADGDPLEVLARVADFEAFRPTLVAAPAYSGGAKGGRPTYDLVMMRRDEFV